MKVDWDDFMPQTIQDVWFKWRSGLQTLSGKHICRCYSPNDVRVVSIQLHGFCDASENVYASVVYLHLTDSDGSVHVTLVTAKTKEAPIK